MVDEVEGRLTHNLTHFARALRVAGLPVGPARVVDAVRAVMAATNNACPPPRLATVIEGMLL